MKTGFYKYIYLACGIAWQARQSESHIWVTNRMPRRAYRAPICSCFLRHIDAYNLLMLLCVLHASSAPFLPSGDLSSWCSLIVPGPAGPRGLPHR